MLYFKSCFMADTLDRTFFESHLREDFQVDGGPIALKLVECNRMKSQSGELREPFSLLFRGPAESMLPQRSYALSNERTGQIEIFLVPVARDAAGVTYEAVFN